MVFEIIRPEVVQNISQFIQLGLIVFGVTCLTCGFKYKKKPRCPDCGSDLTVEKYKKEQNEFHRRVTELFPDGMPTCGGDSFNSEGDGGGGASKNIVLFKPQKKPNKK